MPAYIVVLWEEDLVPSWGDPTELDPYADQVEATFAPYGGRFLRLAEHPLEVLEGELPALGVGITEFPSMDQARAWYHSAAYAPLREWRMARGRFSLLLLEGLPAGATLRSTALAEVEAARAQQRRDGAQPGEGSAPP
jgi:uncharacterized protein (DUF1330 family)